MHRRPLRFFSLIIIAVLLAATAPIQPVRADTELPPPSFHFVKDINTNTMGSDPFGIYAHNGALYFLAYTRDTGLEIWTSDGTDTGTRLLKDIRPGLEGQAHLTLAEMFASLGDTLFFLADDGMQGIELWKSDGTEAGTVMVKDISSTSQSIGYLTTFGSWVYFFYYEASGIRLWRTDGTSEHTVPVGDLDYDDWVRNPFVFDGALYVTAQESTTGGHGMELWRTTPDLPDGSPGPMELVADLAFGPMGSSPDDFIRMDGALFFTAYDAENYGREIWKLEAGGTPQVLDIQPGTTSSSPGDLEVFQEHLYFRAYDPAVGNTLWRTDGTLAGTEMVAQFASGAVFTEPWFMKSAGNALYFTATEPAQGRELYRYDGAALQSFDICPGVCDSGIGGEIVPFNGDVYFSARIDPLNSYNASELWRSGPGGTVMVKDIYPGETGSMPRSLTVMGDRLYFRAVDSLHGGELFTSDGTDAGTQIAADINTFSENDWVITPTPLGQQLFFLSYRAPYGLEPWVSDGTAEGTRMLADINPNGDGGYINEFYNPPPLLPIETGENLYFLGRGADGDPQLWRTSGTPETTALAAVPSVLPAALAGSDGELFWLEKTTSAAGLCYTSEQGTKAADACLHFSNADVLPELAAGGGWVYALLNNLSSGKAELWRTDGAGGHHEMVTALDGLARTAKPGLITAGLYVYFFVDGSLWRSDGTSAGTGAIPNPSTHPVLVPQQMYAAGSRLYFTVHYSSGGTNWGETLFTTGEGENNIRHVINLYNTVQGMTHSGETFYFAGHDGSSGNVVWITDGLGSAEEVCKTCTFNSYQVIDGLAADPPWVYFAASDNPMSNIELWAAGGSASTAFMMADLLPGIEGSSPTSFVQVGEQLFFVAHHPQFGYGLWVYRALPLYLPLLRR